MKKCTCRAPEPGWPQHTSWCGQPEDPPRLLDLFCGAGGCSVGYARAGFEVTGYDLLPHPDYPYTLNIGDALNVLRWGNLDEYDVIHASPPCQAYSTATADHSRHPRLIEPVRDLLLEWGGVYVIENVPGAPLRTPIRLCGSSFDLRVRRHRMFESNAPLMQLPCRHASVPVGVYGDHPDSQPFKRPTGTSRGAKATSLEDGQDAMGIDWITNWDDLTDAIPPAYCEFVGTQLLDHLGRAAA